MDYNISNTTDYNQTLIEALSEDLFTICSLAVLSVTCVIAVCINIAVIASVRWVRGPMTPNVKISLSLAAADAFSSSMYGFALIQDLLCSDFTKGILELFKLAGIVVTAAHLMALAVNHYIGIMRPLHYNSIVTSRKVFIVIVLLWITPTIIVFALYYSFEEGLEYGVYENSTNVTVEGTNTFSFRMSFSSLFFVPMLLMIFCYTHILFVVRQQQQRWNNLARSGSTRFRGRQVKSCTSKSSNGHLNREQRQLEGTVKAIHTTLLIVGSCLLGWTPALVIYVLCCQGGCYFTGEKLANLNTNYREAVQTVRLIENMLVILKMMANPIIYSIRMREIKDGTQRMKLAILSLFCPSRRDLDTYSAVCQRTNVYNSTATSSMNQRMTSFRTNGSSLHGSGKDFGNTFL